MVSEKENDVAHFDGFRKKDFADFAGTSWRGREAFGGVLGGALSRSSCNRYGSWAVARRLELHIARQGCYDFDDPVRYAKLFVYTSEDEVAYGLFIEAAQRGHKDSAKHVH